MKKVLKTLLVITLVILSTGCKKNYLNEISYKEYEKKLNNKESFILEIMRTDCSACISFKPKLTEVVNKYKVTVYFINTDHISDSEKDKLFENTGISGTPTVIFYENGTEETISSRITGSVSTDRIISKFKANDIIKE